MRFGHRTALLAVLLLLVAGLASVAAPASAVDPDLVATWSFDDTTGVTATDSVDSHDGTLENGPVWDFGILGAGGLRFDGVDDIVTVPDHADLRQSGSISVDVWIKPASIQDGTLFLNGTGEGTTWNVYLGVEAIADPLELIVNFDLFTTGGIVRMEGSTPLTIGSWNHIVAVYDSSAETMAIYVNGALDTSIDAGSSSLMTAFQWVHPMGIGNNFACTGSAYPSGCTLKRPFHGFLDEFSFYSRALSPTEIADGHAFLPVFCDGRIASLAGTDGSEILDGTSGPDVIVGRDGDDTINGFADDDLICAGDGDDTVNGGSGDDTIYGQNGMDEIYGDNGTDVIFGGSKRDDIRGGKGSDEIHGGPGNDRIWGDGNTDLAWGGGGNDRIRGGVGGDTLHGQDGDDKVIGQGGDDILFGDGGTDVAKGKAGTDACDAETEITCEVDPLP